MSKFYIYEITNKLNGKTYIGQRKCPANKTPETDKYFGSGTLLKKDIDKYGIKNFNKKVICETDDFNKANELEIKYISMGKSKKKCEYNISKGGQGKITNKIEPIHSECELSNLIDYIKYLIYVKGYIGDFGKLINNLLEITRYKII